MIHNADMRTAWSDKHAVYTSYNGPGSNGTSIDDFFGPEIDCTGGRAERRAVPGRRRVDGRQRRDQAVRLLQGPGGHSIGSTATNTPGTGPTVGTPAIYGMNFQTVSTAEKLKSSPSVLIGPDAEGNYTEGPSLPGGYVTVDGQQVPGPLLRGALDYVNAALERMADTIQADGEAELDGDHPDRQAWPVAAEQQPAAADR